MQCTGRCPLSANSGHGRSSKLTVELYRISDEHRLRQLIGGVRDSVGNAVGKVGQFSRSRSLHEIVPQGARGGVAARHPLRRPCNVAPIDTNGLLMAKKQSDADMLRREPV